MGSIELQGKSEAGAQKNCIQGWQLRVGVAASRGGEWLRPAWEFRFSRSGMEMADPVAALQLRAHRRNPPHPLLERRTGLRHPPHPRPITPLKVEEVVFCRRGGESRGKMEGIQCATRRITSGDEPDSALATKTARGSEKPGSTERADANRVACFSVPAIGAAACGTCACSGRVARSHAVAMGRISSGRTRTTPEAVWPHIGCRRGQCSAVC